MTRALAVRGGGLLSQPPPSDPVLPAVREKAKQIIELLNDNERIRDEREKARRLRDKYVGVGSEGSKFACAKCAAETHQPPN